MLVLFLFFLFFLVLGYAASKVTAHIVNASKKRKKEGCTAATPEWFPMNLD